MVVSGRLLWVGLVATVLLSTLFFLNGLLYTGSECRNNVYEEAKKTRELLTGPIFFTHLFNPFLKDNELPKDQLLTIQSMKAATKEASLYGIYAEQVASVYPSDSSFFTHHPEIQFGAPYLNRTIRNEIGRDTLRPVPFLADILERGLTHGSGTYAVYSNSDISLHTSFYWRVAQILRETNLSSLSITRVPPLYHNRTAVGLADIKSFDQIINNMNQIKEGFPCEWKLGTHIGDDMFIFPREWLNDILPKIKIVLGFPPIGCLIEKLLIQKCNEKTSNPSTCYKKFTDLQLTFHIGFGGEGGWTRDTSVDNDFTSIYNVLMVPDDVTACKSRLFNYCKMCINETRIQCPEIWNLLVDNELDVHFRENCDLVRKMYPDWH